jgi:hypothetical protein
VNQFVQLVAKLRGGGEIQLADGDHSHRVAVRLNSNFKLARQYRGVSPGRLWVDR